MGNKLIVGMLESVKLADFPADGVFCSTIDQFNECIEKAVAPALFQADFERGPHWWILAETTDGDLCLCAPFSCVWGYSPKAIKSQFDSQYNHQRLAAPEWSKFVKQTFTPTV